MKKYAVMTMDVEDWYDAGYILGMDVDKNYTMSDGLNNYVQILNAYGIKGTFFTLSDMLKWVSSDLKKFFDEGHEIGIHGQDHIRPVEKSVAKFKEEISEAKNAVETLIGKEIKGYRAPSYGIDREHLNVIQQLGFQYDSSKIDSQSNSFYEKLDLIDFEQIDKGIYRKNGFYEFEISTGKLLNKRCTIAGGGFFRIFPWVVTKRMITKFLKQENFYVFFIHPFEVSSKKVPTVKGLSFLKKVRIKLGRKTVQKKIHKLIKLLIKEGYEFVTFDELMRIKSQEATEKLG